MFEKPMGGTELMYQELMQRLPQEYKDKFSIFNYIDNADFSKTTIYWNQLSYDQKAVEFLKNPKNIESINNFVFVSHWQSEQFRKIYNIPGYKTHVLKNACSNIIPRKSGIRDKLKICYTSTPWRGLDILLDAWEILQPENCELHVFSSCKIYGEDFSKNDNQYQFLYDKCEQLSNVVYRGSIPNNQLKEELSSFDILAYPNTFEETSCIAIIEALSTGLRVITSNLGALPETTEGWARMYPFLMDPKRHSKYFAKLLDEEIEFVKNNKFDSSLQSSFYYNRWNWDNRIVEWKNFLDEL